MFVSSSSSITRSSVEAYYFAVLSDRGAVKSDLDQSLMEAVEEFLAEFPYYRPDYLDQGDTPEYLVTVMGAIKDYRDSV